MPARRKDSPWLVVLFGAALLIAGVVSFVVGVSQHLQRTAERSLVLVPAGAVVIVVGIVLVVRSKRIG